MERNQIPYFSKNCTIQCTPCDIVNTFNNYFASVAKTSKKSIKYSHKLFSDYLSNESSGTVFLQPTDNMCSCHSS